MCEVCNASNKYLLPNKSAIKCFYTGDFIIGLSSTNSKSHEDNLQKITTKNNDYHSYKYFNNESFREELLQIEANGSNCDESFKHFTSSCNVILNKHAPQKKKVFKGKSTTFHE